ncbi:MAG: hypothetical protein J1E59_07235 [Treponema sp.]|nr:hypothetical protein [Treponema sp.]
MANGIEDLKEKNKSRQEVLSKNQFTQWRNFQGREDAEMLEEKSSRWGAQKASCFRREYDDWRDD